MQIPTYPQQLDFVKQGLDAAYNYFGKHCFFSEKDVLEYMQSKEIVVKDHHKGE